MERLKEFGRYSKRVFSRSKPKEEAAYLNFITDFREEKFSIIWRIENIYRCTLKRGEFLESPSFSAGPSNDVKWTLRFYPVGRKTPENATQRKPIPNEFNVLQMTRSRNPPLTVESRSGLFIKRITEDPVTSSFKYRFVCEVPKQLSNSSILKKNATFLYPDEGTADIIIDSTKSSEYGTDNIFRIFDLAMIQTLVVRCEIYVTNAHNMEDSDNNIPDSTKFDLTHCIKISKQFTTIRNFPTSVCKLEILSFPLTKSS